MYERIPDDLKQLDQWVCAWNDSKVPMKAYEMSAASSSDPDTWSDFETAQAAVQAGYYDHVGFVFADTGLVGIDIDKGFEGGQMTALCRDIMSACMSYTEVSKSGRGVHIFLKGTLPFSGRNNRNGVEIYRSRRFFITTGNVLGFEHIIENQYAIDYVVSKYFPEVRSEHTAAESRRIYSATWKKPDGTIRLVPEYQEILQGGRNVCLLSVAGQMRSAGYGRKRIYQELLRANREACKPPLSDGEVQRIVESIMRYKR